MPKVKISEYARLHNKEVVSVRRKCARGYFATAEKRGRDWFIDLDEPYLNCRNGAGRELKLRKAKELSGFGKHPNTCHDIFMQVPDSIIDRCTAQEIADIAISINKAYHAGRTSTGAEMVDEYSVWIEKYQRIFDVRTLDAGGQET